MYHKVRWFKLKQRKIPMRSCVVTKDKYPKQELVRVVRDNQGLVSVDLTGKLNGHGAYLKKDLEVLNIAKKTNILERYLETEIPESVYKELEEIISK